MKPNVVATHLVKIIKAARSQQSLVDELMQDYLNELSAYESIAMDAGGRFQYPFLKHYWREPDRYPFLIVAGEQTVGFVLLRRDMNPENGSRFVEVAEFFVVPKWRRQKVGTIAAQLIWPLFPGPWCVSVLEKNLPAAKFWRQQIIQSAGSCTEESPSSANFRKTIFRFQYCAEPIVD